ncbi:unnamed protein product [Clavelina lepadiformis]|uniref:Uncharacterized protein n=1 Tax=Clavelina lepadiformis TaxID=159417 RepID=A0ABP0F647_CLALP
MSEYAWRRSPIFNRRGRRPMLTYVPDGFKEFLQNKIQPVPANNNQERNHVVRRALALYRLCWSDVPDGWDLLDERMRSTLGSDWMKNFEDLTGDEVVKEYSSF